MGLKVSSFYFAYPFVVMAIVINEEQRAVAFKKAGSDILFLLDGCATQPHSEDAMRGHDEMKTSGVTSSDYRLSPEIDLRAGPRVRLLDALRC